MRSLFLDFQYALRLARKNAGFTLVAVLISGLLLKLDSRDMLALIFAITLVIGLVANLFTAVFVSRFIFDAELSGKRQVAALSI